jgi:hypothetical protein
VFDCRNNCYDFDSQNVFDSCVRVFLLEVTLVVEVRLASGWVDRMLTEELSAADLNQRPGVSIVCSDLVYRPLL